MLTLPILLCDKDEGCAVLCVWKSAKGSPIENVAAGIWALPVWGGGSKPLPGWFGATFFGRISFILGGSRPLPGWFGALFSEMKCPRVPV